MRDMVTGIDTKPYVEWLNGVESVAVSPNPAHAVIGVTLASIMNRYGSAFGGAMTEVHVRIDAGTILLPDVAFYRFEVFRKLERPDRTLPPVPPDVIAEVRSPNDRPGFRNEKIRRYLAWGCPLILDVDPVARTVIVHSPTEVRSLSEADRFDDPVVPWLQFNVRELFERLDLFGL
jgi:Uma2 family endonuclease